MAMTRKKSFFNLDLEGFEALEAELNKLPIRVRNKALRTALNAGTEIIQKEAIRLCPRGADVTVFKNAYAQFSDDSESLHMNIVTRVRVTKKGEQVLERVFPVYRRGVLSALNLLSDSDKDRLCGFLEKIRGSMDAGEGD